MPSPESTLKHKKLALGRGLSALIPDAGPTFQPEDGFFLCEIDLFRPNRFQPRHQYAEEELAELTGSIREQGVLQPLIVRKSDPGFELIAGGRRRRAARRAGLSQVPVVHCAPMLPGVPVIFISGIPIGIRSLQDRPFTQTMPNAIRS